MSSRLLTLHTFASVKGGVGKSTLAIACAKLLAAPRDAGRHPVLIDCDQTGTSLADGLRLLPPVLARSPDGAPVLEAPPTGEHHRPSPDEPERPAWRAAFSGRGRARQPFDPPFLNDVMHQSVDSEGTLRVDAMLWRHEQDDGVRYLPSSPLDTDLADALRWIEGEHDGWGEWAQRLAWGIDRLIRHDSAVTDVILDLPPGVWGIGHEVHALANTLAHGHSLPAGYPEGWNTDELRWRVNPFLVTSPDRQALLSALDYLGFCLRPVPGFRGLRPLVNRTTEAPEHIRRRARLLSGDLRAQLGLDELLVLVSEMETTLGRVFLDGDLGVDEKVLELRGVLRLVP
ncbi:MAG: ParA family protein [Myxococcales bacterium]|nr:ParA family protein [Myxococcales bacterium]